MTVEIGEICVRRQLAVGFEVRSRFFIEEKLDNEKERAAKDRIIEFLRIQEYLMFLTVLML